MKAWTDWRLFMEGQHKIALLIDAENVSKKYIKLIMNEIGEYGVVTYKRVYGDFTSAGVAAWKNNLVDYAMTPVFQVNYTKGKNASDSAMVIDAMDILYSGKVNGFCLVTSDSDFTKLAIRLREAGMLVVGMGEQKTPNSLVAACETFKYLDLLYREEEKNDSEVQEELITEEIEAMAETETKSAKRGKTRSLANGDAAEKITKTAAKKAAAKLAAKAEKNEEAELEEAEEIEAEETELEEDTRESRIPDRTIVGKEITAIIESISDEAGWAFLGVVGNLLAKRIPGFDPRNYGYKKLRSFIESYDCYETQDTKNPKNNFLKLVYVRIK